MLILTFITFFFFSVFFAEVSVEPINQTWFLVTFQINSSQEEVFWCSEQFSWKPIPMKRLFKKEASLFQLQILMQKGNYQFKYKDTNQKWFVDSSSSQITSYSQLTQIPNKFQSTNNLLQIRAKKDEEFTSLNQKAAVFSYSFEITPAHIRLFESPPRLVLYLAPIFGKKVQLWVEEKAYPLHLGFQEENLLGFEISPIPIGKAFFQIGEWYLYPSGLSKEKRAERFTFLEPAKWLQSKKFKNLKKSQQKHYGKIVYQIFPDRFCKGNPIQRLDEKKWGEKPENSWDFFGGDLRGIIQKLDYLASLGVEIIYLNPIFLADTNHRYNTTDYFQIDPRLGSLEDFQELIQKAKEKGIEILLDGVFNHTGESFFAFQDLVKKKANSKYREWYYVLKFPLKEGKKINYEGWWGIGSLPKLRITNKEVRAYIYKVSQYWSKLGIAGFRLDVPNEWRKDYWPEFRQQLLATFPQSILIGEIWERGDYWLYGNRFDGIMHYPLRNWILDLVLEKEKAIFHFKQKVKNFDFSYGSWSRHMNWTVLSSHDTKRFFTEVKRQKKCFKMGVLLQFGLPGMPVIYYGDEVALLGGKDPDCRRCYPWEKQDRLLIQFYQKLGQYRKNRLSLKYGSLEFLKAPSKVLLFRRVYQEEGTYILCNPSTKRQQVEIPFRVEPAKILFSKNIEKQQTTAKKTILWIAPQSGVYFEGPSAFN